MFIKIFYNTQHETGKVQVNEICGQGWSREPCAGHTGTGQHQPSQIPQLHGTLSQNTERWSQGVRRVAAVS